MKAKDYWKYYSGYWELFKSKETFTLLWEAILEASEEYAEIYGAINHGGLLDSPATIRLRWERVYISGDTVNVKLSNGEYLECDIVNIPTMRRIGSTEAYSEGIDYTYSNGVFGWIAPDPPSDQYYLCDSVYIDPGILERYYNNTVFDIDLSVYLGDDRKYILGACAHHLGSAKTKLSLMAIANILFGVPFSRYYAEFSRIGNTTTVNYAIVVTSNHVKFMRERGLHDYYLISEDGESIYDINTLDEDIPAGEACRLSHKRNMVYSGGRYGMIIGAETYSTDKELFYTHGEGIPIYDIMTDCIEGTEETVAATNSVIPIANIMSTGNCITGTISSEEASLVKPRMMLNYSVYTQIAQGDITVIQGDMLEIKDSVGMDLRIGDHLYITYSDLTCQQTNIMAGSYNESGSSYVVQTHHRLRSSYITSIRLHAMKSAACTVIKTNLTIVVVVSLPAAPEAAYLTPIKGYVEAVNYAVTSVIDDSTLRLDTVSGLTEYATIVIHENGEQRHHVITEVCDGNVIKVFPDLVSVTTNAAVAVIPNISAGRVVLIMPEDVRIERLVREFWESYNSGDEEITFTEEIDHVTFSKILERVYEEYITLAGDPYTGVLPFEMEIMAGNLQKYIDIWSPGVIIEDGSKTRFNFTDINTTGPVMRDVRYWKIIGKEAKKEIRG